MERFPQVSVANLAPTMYILFVDGGDIFQENKGA
jgi:hypothetical protein